MSDVGCQRQNNEDHYFYWEPADDEQFQRKGRLAMVADGMGGHEGGQEASRIAVEAVRELYAELPGEGTQSLLATAFHEAHTRIQDYAARHPLLRGMGTTATAIVLLNYRLYYAHIGDSRLYLSRDRNVSRLTLDHSYVGRLLENGVITAEEAEAHPQRHVLTAALGVGPEVTPDFPEQAIPLEPGDTLILCTDGLWGLVSEEELQEAVEASPPSDACRFLIEMAKERGGPDNITVQVLRVV